MTCPGCKEIGKRIEKIETLATNFCNKAMLVVAERDAIRAEVARLKSEKDAAVREAVGNALSEAWQPAQVEEPKNIHTNTDAKVWAEFFVSVFPGQKHMEGLMLTWFANAIMAGVDATSVAMEKKKDAAVGKAVEARDELIKNLAMFIRRLCSGKNTDCVKDQSMRFLKNVGLEGSILRTTPP